MRKKSTWLSVYNSNLSRDYDPAYSAWMANKWEEKQKPVFSNCNVCGREFVKKEELNMGMCLICANE